MGDILQNYRITTEKLKKRFLRKPNITEACESFTNLGKQCEHAEMSEYAGMCWIAAAKCEGSLQNVPGESACLIRAAEQFTSAEYKNQHLGCPGPSQENLQSGLYSFARASENYSENSPLNISINLQMADCLRHLEKEITSEMYLKNAVNLAHKSLDTKTFCLQKLASHYIATGNYVSALESLTEITNLLTNCPINSARSDMLQNLEITTVLLLLILRPAPQIIAPSLGKLLEKYTWGVSGHKSIKLCRMPMKFFLLIQTLVLACQSSDLEALIEVQSNLWPEFNVEQRELLHILVNAYSY